MRMQNNAEFDVNLIRFQSQVDYSKMREGISDGIEPNVIVVEFI